MNHSEKIACILKLNPNAKFVVKGADSTVKYDAAHKGIKPTDEDLEAVLDEIKSVLLSESESKQALIDLKELDRNSIRSIREFLSKKFSSDPDIPPELLEYEVSAKDKRTKLK